MLIPVDRVLANGLPQCRHGVRKDGSRMLPCDPVYAIAPFLHENIHALLTSSWMLLNNNIDSVSRNPRRGEYNIDRPTTSELYRQQYIHLV